MLILKDEYEKMKETLKQKKAKKIMQSINSGLKDVKEGKTHNIATLWDKF